MDSGIERRLLKSKFFAMQGTSLTPEEMKRFESVTLDRVTGELGRILPGELITVDSINGINPLNGAVIYTDSRKRHTLPLTELGYNLVEFDDTFQKYEKYLPKVKQ